MAFTSDDLISRVKITGTIPENQALITASRILSFADEEIAGEIVPLLDSTNQNYMVAIEEETITSGQESYSIPSRAVGRKLRDLKITDGSAIRSLALVALEDAQYYNFSAQPNSFYFQNDKIILLPKPSSSGQTLQKYYNIRPSRLIEMQDAGVIQGISGAVLTLSAVPSAFVSGYKVDLVSGKSGYQSVAIDKTIASISGNQVTLTAAVTGLSIGDYICKAECSPVVQAPDDVVLYLVSRVTKRCLEAIGDTEGAGVIAKNLPEQRRSLLMLLQPRIEGESTKIIQRNGLLRGYRQLRYFRGVLG